MSSKSSDPTVGVFELSATLAGGGDPESVINDTVTTLSAVFDRPAAVWRRTGDGTATLVEYATPAESNETPWDGSRPFEQPQSETNAGGPPDADDESPNRVVADSQPAALNAERLAAAGERHILGVGATEADDLRSRETTAVTALAAALGAALDRTTRRERTDAAQAEADHRRSAGPDDERATVGADPGNINADAAAFRRLHELTVETDGFETTVERLLSLGCEHFGLETGMLARIEGGEYAVEGVVDATGTYEAGTVVDVDETMCAVTVARETTAPLAAADIAATEHATHPVADGVGAYIGVPVVVDGETYGTVNFSSPAAREEPFRPGEEELIKHVAQWIGATIGRRRRETTLERDRTLLQAIGDPVYALDPAGRFTFLNEAGRATFGDPTIVGEHVSTVLPEEALAAGQRALDRLTETDGRSETVTLELETADGERRIFENQIGLIDGDRSAGTIGVLRDITDRETKRRRLTSFQAAIENAADGVAVLEDGEYTYIDRTHVEMYGFEEKAQLLGNSWRRLYDADEISRLEREAFPALAAEGAWRGTVTGTRPDGTTFPAEISLTQLEDDRIVCTVRDITDRRERECELRLKERAMDEAAVGIEITDVTGPESEVVYINSGFEALTGYDYTEVIGDPPRKLEGERTDIESVASLQAAVAGETAETVELEYHRKDGTPYWARVSVTPIHDETGTLTNIIQVQQDITELKQRQAELQESKGRYQTLLQAAPDPVVIADADTGEIVEANAAAAALRGEPRASLLGRDQSVLHPADDRQAYQELFARATQEDAVYSALQDGTQTLFRTADGGGVPVEISAQTVDLAGRDVIYGVFRDISDRKQTEQELTVLTENIDEYAFFIVGDDDGTIRSWNTGAREMFGYEVGQAVGMGVEQLCTAAGQEAKLARRLRQQARIAGDSAHEEWYRRADGSEFYADVRYASLEDDAGLVRRHAVIVRDMTEQRRRERRTERFVEESEDVVSIVAPDGTISYVSGSAERVLGYDRDTLIGETLFDYLHPEEREAAMAAFFESVDTGADRTLTDCRMTDGEGAWLTVEGRVRNMLDDEAIDGMLVYLRDVTERRERARRLEAIFNGTYQFTGLLEPDGTVIEVNEAALAFGGFDEAAVVGEKFYDAPWWTHDDQVRADAHDAIERAATGEFVRYEVEVQGADGLATIDFSVKPVPGDDGTTSMLIVEGREITALKQQRQHLAVLQRLIRHNIRNDLTKVRGWTWALYNETDPAEQTRQFERIKSVLEKWEAMSQKLAEIRRVLSAQQTLRSTVSPETLLTGALEQAETPPAAVQTQVSSSESLRVSQVTEEALRELIENATEAIDEDGTVSIELAEPDPGWLEITVSDDGPGLPAAERAVLQTGEETALDHGAGLGLWMVRMLVKQAGGRIATDVTGEGTTVRLSFPATDRTTGDTADGSENGEENRDRGRDEGGDDGKGR